MGRNPGPMRSGIHFFMASQQNARQFLARLPQRAEGLCYFFTG